MASPIVSKRQMLKLLNKLSGDDGFRSRFEKGPKSALIEAGIPAAQVATFPADHVAPGALPDKSQFKAEHQRVENDIAEECMCMVSPNLKMGAGLRPKEQ